MGQKISPISLRLGLKKDWKSKWFSQKEYALQIKEDEQIRNLIRSRFSLGTLGLIEIERDRGEVKVKIHTAKPGVVIGRSGKGTEELKNFLEKKVGKKINIEIFEIDKPTLVAQIIAENMAYQIEKRVAYRRAAKLAIDRAIEAGAKGIKVTISGRLGGVEIARKETLIAGSIPTQTLRADIDFAKVDAKTTYGVIGVKVWIYKGERFE